MAHTPHRVWRGERRRLLKATKDHLDRLVADRDRETKKASDGKTPLYLSPPGGSLWDKVADLVSQIGQALIAVA